MFNFHTHTHTHTHTLAHTHTPVATLAVSLANLEGEESFDAAMLGSAESVVQERVCDDELILVKG